MAKRFRRRDSRTNNGNCMISYRFLKIIFDYAGLIILYFVNVILVTYVFINILRLSQRTKFSPVAIISRAIILVQKVESFYVYRCEKNLKRCCLFKKKKNEKKQRGRKREKGNEQEDKVRRVKEIALRKVEVRYRLLLAGCLASDISLEFSFVAMNQSFQDARYIRTSLEKRFLTRVEISALKMLETFDPSNALSLFISRRNADYTRINEM